MIAQACLFSLALFVADGPQTLPLGHVAYKTPAPIVVDGRLDDEGWRDLPWTDEFQDIEGDVKPRPRFKTRAKMAWDDRYFYVAAWMDEPHVWGTLTKHDSVIFHDNDFEVFIDPDGDNHEYYELEINALNTEWDLFLPKPYRDGGPARDDWEVPGLLKAVHVDGTINDPSDTDKGWSVELAIPWEVLKEYAHRPAPPREGDQWRVNFSRVEWETIIADGTYQKVKGKREDNWVWSPQGAIDMHRPEKWGHVQFSTKRPGEDTFRRDPDGPTRDRLMAVYHAQKAHFGAHKNWAQRIEDLKIDQAPGITLRTTPDGYEATLKGPGKTWRVRHDSKLLSD